MYIVTATLRTVFVYILFSTMWILFSDTLLEYLVVDFQTLSLIQTYKGLFFILITSILLFFLIKNQTKHNALMQQKLKERQRRLEYVVRGANLGYWDWDYVNNTHWVNDTWLSFLGLKRSDIKKNVNDWLDALHPDDILIAKEAIEGAVHDGKPYVIEFRMRHRDGHWVWIEGSGAVVEWDEKRENPLRLAGTHRNITERKKSQEEIDFLAHNDLLTKLPNRYFLKQHLDTVLKEKKEDAFLFLDLDYFKNINDLYGHSVGDSVIQEVAKRFQSCLSENDFLARVGGDEFVVLTHHTKSETLAKELIDSLKTPFHIAQEQCILGVSIGIATVPQDGISFEELFKKADIAMYVAKESGKNSYFYYQSQMMDKIVDSTTLDKDLKEAIANEEFVLYYQPIVDLQSLEILGVEALVRWEHPEKGLIFPDAFIPRCEETQLIVSLGELIFKKAVTQLALWEKAGLFGGMMAINISSVQIEQDDFLLFVQRVYRELNVDYRRVELEVTESFIMQNPNQSAKTLQKLKNIGFHISIDDFGTGYSSLNYLKNLPIDKLKIDRSFVMDLPDDKEDRAIVRTIVSLAKNLELEVLAEGVETKEQKEFLTENWCDSAQGYYFAKPLSVLDFENFIKKTNF